MERNIRSIVVVDSTVTVEVLVVETVASGMVVIRL